jgi:hypothetical protein
LSNADRWQLPSALPAAGFSAALKRIF